MLTPEQKAAARELFKIRPPVVPGTRVILDVDQKNDWYARVTARMQALGIITATGGDPKAVKEFCDLAGVAD